MKNIKTYEQFILESSNYYEKDSLFFDSLMEEFFQILKNYEDEELLESLVDEDDKKYENMSQEELDEICEFEYQNFRKFIDEDIIGRKKIDEGISKKTKSALKTGGIAAASVPAAAIATTAAINAGIPTFAAGTSLTTILAAGQASYVAPLIAAQPYLIVAAAAGIVIAKIISRKRAIKKALSKIDSRAEQDKLREQLKKLSTSQIKEYNKIQEASALVRAAKKTAKGETPKLPDNATPAQKKGFEKGVKLGEMGKESVEKMKNLPKEKKEELAKKLVSKLDSVKSTAEKVEDAGKAIEKEKEANKK